MRFRSHPFGAPVALEIGLLALFCPTLPGPALASTHDVSVPLLSGAESLAVDQETRPDTSRSAPPDTTAHGLKRMTVDDYALWRSVGNASLSPDGKWVTYSYTRREVDDSLFIQPLERGGPHVAIRGSDPAFSADSRWVAFYVNPPDTSGNGARQGASPPAGAPGREGRGGGGGPRALVLLSLATRDTVRWENVQAFSFSRDAGVLVVKKRKVDSEAEHDGTDLVVRYLDAGEDELLAYVNEWALDRTGTRLAYTLDGPGGEANGLFLLDLTTRARRTLDAERETAYARLTWGDDKDRPSADALAVLKGGKSEKVVERENALLVWPAVSESLRPVALDPRPAKEDSAGAEGRSPSPASSQARQPDPFPKGWVLSEKGEITWAPDASRLFVATRPQLPAPNTLCKPREEERPGRGRARTDSTSAAGGGTGGAGAGGGGGGVAPGGGVAQTDTMVAKTEADSTAGPKIFRMASRYDAEGRPLGPEEVLNGECPEFMADVDIWHVEDEQLQSVQMIRANRDKSQTYQGVVLLAAGARGAEQTARFVQLTDTTMESLEVSANGRFAMGRDPKPYVSDWEPGYADYYLVDLETGGRTPVLEEHLRTLGFSPNGQHYLYWKDRHVWSYDVASGARRNLTVGIPVTFEDEEYDRWGEKPPHGVGGWTKDSTSVILEHRYDLYLVPMDGGEATNLTRGIGAQGETQLRIIELDPEEDLVDLEEPVLLSAFGQWTKKAGFYLLENGRLRERVLDDARFGRRVLKADSTALLLYTKEDFETFPDYWISGMDFSRPRQVTDADPQQAEFNWGRRILFDYETADGVRLQGTLAIPYDYQPGEQRPMLVSFYEKYSQDLHAYPMPIFRDTPMFAEYVSAGYLVMQPDIRFRFGATHAQMLECINLAIDKVEEMGYVDPDRIGLHGHSFSGQGAAYISTHSDRFAAIVAGAAATNLVSDFNQLWKSSGTNQHGYDTYGQGRFATNPYDDFELFVDQSATPNAANMNTPLLILHGTADGSVEWLQAVEFYNGLRWNGKNVILMSYPGEPHHLTKYENQKDFQIRMRQFFDHYLRDKPAPRWMESGRTFLDKERDVEMVRPRRSGGGG
jgi:dipeptidyl aminopeptidase/acylaminoacyl peptidase